MKSKGHGCWDCLYWHNLFGCNYELMPEFILGILSNSEQYTEEKIKQRKAKDCHCWDKAGE